MRRDIGGVGCGYMELDGLQAEYALRTAHSMGKEFAGNSGGVRGSKHRAARGPRRLSASEPGSSNRPWCAHTHVRPILAQLLNPVAPAAEAQPRAPSELLLVDVYPAGRPTGAEIVKVQAVNFT